MKCGTTSMCELLRQHPDVFITEPKEPEFFSEDKCFQLGWQWYEALFAAANDEKARGEGSVTYSIAQRYPEALPRIAESLADAKIIYMVRHPMERMESEYRQRKRWGRHVGSDFRETCLTYPLVETSSYWKQISLYREHFPDDQIHVVFFEDFKVAPERELRQVFKFLEVDPEIQIKHAEKPHNAAASWRRDTKLSRWSRNVPGFDAIKNRIPLDLKTNLRRLFTKSVLTETDLTPHWDADLRRTVADQLRGDADSFLAHFGKSNDFWGFGDHDL